MTIEGYAMYTPIGQLDWVAFLESKFGFRVYEPSMHFWTVGHQSNHSLSPMLTPFSSRLPPPAHKRRQEELAREQSSYRQCRRFRSTRRSRQRRPWEPQARPYTGRGRRVPGGWRDEG